MNSQSAATTRCLLILLCIPLSCLIVGNCHAQKQLKKQEVQNDSPDKIVNDFIDAIGGEMSLRSLGDVRIKGRIQFAKLDTPAEFTFRFSEGKFFNSHQRETAKKYQTAYDGIETSWGAFIGEDWKIEPAHDTTVYMLKSPTQLLDWLDRPKPMKWIGNVTFAEKEAIQIDFTHPRGKVIARFFDRESHLLLGEKMSGNLARRFEYQEHEDVQFFKSIQSISSGAPYNVTRYEEIETNVDLDANLFVPPTDDK